MATVESLLVPPEPPASLDVVDVELPPAPPPAVAEARPRPSRSSYIDPIVERSIFDASKVGGPAKEAPTDGLPQTELDLVLVATLVADPEIYSSAWIGREETRRVRRPRKGRRRSRSVQVSEIEDGHGYGVGDAIVGHDVTVVAIEQGQVTLQREDGTLELLLAEDEPESTGSTEKVDTEAEDGIAQVAEDHYTVERSLVDKLIADPSEVMKLGRAIPHRGPGGEVDGFRLSGIRRSSLGRKIGLRSGDVVQSVNGHSLTDMSSAMTAFNDLRDASSLEVELERRGKPRKLRVDIN